MRNNKNNITCNVRNITLNLKNITPHFTGKAKIITLLPAIIMLSFVNIINTSALSYQSSVNIGFTFNPTLSISISPSDLIISNLVPGNTADSNSINVSVATNVAWGYTLLALVSNNSLNHIGSNDKFDSIATDANLVNLTADNTWGYSYKDNTVQTPAWSNYSGLSNSTSKTLLETNTNNTETGIDNIDFKIAAKASSTQASGTYTNTITFTAVTKPTPPTLYETVQSLTKKDAEGNERTQTPAELQAAITAPTSTNHTEDTSNSGVYKYDAETFGNASDAATGYSIYYYRGILEPSNEAHGSSGTATTYPNYVRLANDTCWRIIRTTGSGGVKMIYNGTWTGATCANNQGSTRVTTGAFNGSYNSIVYAGYTYNSNYINNSSTNGISPDVVFGNSDPTVNNTRSTAKTYIEDTWYPNALVAYTSILEPSAGYCNDRSYYGSTTGTTKEQIQPTITTGGTVYFGARNRNLVDDSAGPTLTCTRGDIDIYRYATDGVGLANELKAPAALLTADEAAFAGSGRSTGNPTTYNANSYLCSGNNFWLFSPNYRDSGGVRGFYLTTNGYSNGDYVGRWYDVRPVVSLMHHIRVISGNGTATSPWTISE